MFMADFLEDIAAAFNYSRFKVAIDFRFVKDDNMKAYITSAQSWVNSIAQDYGSDSWQTYGTAFIASLGETLLDFVGNVGEATFIDPLRLGEGYKKGGFGLWRASSRIPQRRAACLPHTPCDLNFFLRYTLPK